MSQVVITQLYCYGMGIIWGWMMHNQLCEIRISKLQVTSLKVREGILLAEIGRRRIELARRQDALRKAKWN